MNKISSSAQPLFSLHNQFFLMVFICYISFLTTCSLFSLLPSTYPSHYSTETFQAKVTKELTGRLPNAVTSFSPHLPSPVYRGFHSEYLSLIFSPPQLSWHCSLQSCGLAAPSQVFLNAGVSRGTFLSIRAPHSPFFTLWSALSAPVSSLVIYLLRALAPHCSSELRVSGPSCWLDSSTVLPTSVSILRCK